MTPHRIGIQVRFADTDAVGHINNVAAKVKSVIVSFDCQAQRSVPMPPPFRAWLEASM